MKIWFLNLAWVRWLTCTLRRVNLARIAWWIGGVVLVTLVVTLVVAFFHIVDKPLTLLSWDYWQKGGLNTSRSEVLRNVGLFGLALIGLGFGVWRVWTAHRQANVSEQQANVSEQGLFTERF